MRGLTAAWLTGMAIVVWRQVHNSHQPPVPGTLVGVTGLFAALALISDAAPSTQRIVTLVAWGLDLAGLMNVLPNGLFGQIQATAENAAGGSSGTDAGGVAGPATGGSVPAGPVGMA